MALNPGDETVAAGTMAKAVYDAMNTIMGSTTGAPDTMRKHLSAAIAQAVCAHIAANADVRIKTTDVALQRYGALLDTDGPAADKVLAGALE